MLSSFSPAFLFASLIWGSVGFGYFIYGKKQSSWVPMTGGVIMILLSYFAPSAMSMSLLSLLIIGCTWYLLKSGY
jgi:hypothetical protein